MECPAGTTIENLEAGQTAYTVSINPNRAKEDVNNALDGAMSMVSLKGRDKIVFKPNRVFPPKLILMELRLEVKYIRLVIFEVKVDGQRRPIKQRVRNLERVSLFSE